MKRAIVDTNIFISATFWHGVPQQVIKVFEAGKATLVLSDAILAELDRKLRHKKFAAELAETGLTVDAIVSGVRAMADLALPADVPEDAIRDPKDRTILFAENADAGLYALPGSDSAENDATKNEIAWGCIWSPGRITLVGGKPTMSPGDDALPPNIDTGSSHGRSDYRYARPSSHHPGGFHVAFAGKNVQFINEKISYIVYAKLMASDDANVKVPGSETLLDERFRNYQLVDEDLNP